MSGAGDTIKVVELESIHSPKENNEEAYLP